MAKSPLRLSRALDVRYGTCDGAACAELTWEAHDENDPTYGHRWAVIGTAAGLSANGEDSAVVCERG
ncbi:hypothetical protein ACVWXM_009993 [Bradyrhizobium sp. GM7.3]